MSPRLAFALRAATEAGRSTLAHFQTGVTFERKADQSPVTVADQHAERLIREALAKEFPNESILGEEEGATGDSPDRWVIDPIDGTKSFVAGVPLYATLLSYEIDEEPVLGVSYFPPLDLIVYAEKGHGAFANGRPIHVSPEEDLSRCFICVGGHKSMAQLGYAERFNSLANRCLATRTWGDAYGHCLVAMGQVQAMIDPVLAPYDVSAVQIIVEEAGGHCTTFQGDRIPRTEAISTNAALHEAILGAMHG